MLSLLKVMCHMLHQITPIDVLTLLKEYPIKVLLTGNNFFFIQKTLPGLIWFFPKSLNFFSVMSWIPVHHFAVSFTIFSPTSCIIVQIYLQKIIHIDLRVEPELSTFVHLDGCCVCWGLKGWNLWYRYVQFSLVRKGVFKVS